MIMAGAWIPTYITSCDYLFHGNKRKFIYHVMFSYKYSIIVNQSIDELLLPKYPELIRECVTLTPWWWFQGFITFNLGRAMAFSSAAIWAK